MAKWYAEVTTYWTQDANGNHPAVTSFFAAGDAGEDITGQPTENILPDPNVVIWRIRVDTATLNAIEADPDHTVLISEEIVEDAI